MKDAAIDHVPSLQREYSFEAARCLPLVQVGHRCARVHGHSYRIVVAVDGALDPSVAGSWTSPRSTSTSSGYRGPAT